MRAGAGERGFGRKMVKVRVCVSEERSDDELREVSSSFLVLQAYS